MVVDKVLVKKISGLAKLEFSEKESEVLAVQLSDILDHMKALDEVNVDGIAPMFHGCIEEASLANDEPRPFNDTMIKNTSPYIKDNFFSVPSILEGE